MEKYTQVKNSQIQVNNSERGSDNRIEIPNEVGSKGQNNPQNYNNNQMMMNQQMVMQNNNLMMIPQFPQRRMILPGRMQ
jgi:hypothetical protein